METLRVHEALTARNRNLDSILDMSDLRLRRPIAAGSLSFTMDLMKGLMRLLPTLHAFAI